MKITISKDYRELSQTTADFISDFVRLKPDALLCFPSGESPTGTLQYLVQYAKDRQVDFSNCTFVGLDEWVGLNGSQEGSCQHYLHTHLLAPLQINRNKVFFFNACAPDLDLECQRIDNFIFEHGPLDLMLVGIGLNGHIGLNEPGVSFDLYSHRIALDNVTKTVAQKYFKQETELHEGITLGLKHLLEAKIAVLIASGAKKSAIIKEALTGAVTNEVPASILQTHLNSFIFLDQEAAAQLT